jgi:hypothetical protein
VCVEGNQQPSTNGWGVGCVYLYDSTDCTTPPMGSPWLLPSGECEDGLPLRAMLVSAPVSPVACTCVVLAPAPVGGTAQPNTARSKVSQLRHLAAVLAVVEDTMATPSLRAAPDGGRRGEGGRPAPTSPTRRPPGTQAAALQRPQLPRRRSKARPQSPDGAGAAPGVQQPQPPGPQVVAPGVSGSGTSAHKMRSAVRSRSPRGAWVSSATPDSPNASGGGDGGDVCDGSNAEAPTGANRVLAHGPRPPSGGGAVAVAQGSLRPRSAYAIRRLASARQVRSRSPRASVGGWPASASFRVAGSRPTSASDRAAADAEAGVQVDVVGVDEPALLGAEVGVVQALAAPPVAAPAVKTEPGGRGGVARVPGEGSRPASALSGRGAGHAAAAPLPARPLGVPTGRQRWAWGNGATAAAGTSGGGGVAAGAQRRSSGVGPVGGAEAGEVASVVAVPGTPAVLSAGPSAGSLCGTSVGPPAPFPAPKRSSSVVVRRGATNTFVCIGARDQCSEVRHALLRRGWQEVG